jgi:uncharacterized membrane protein
MLAMFGIGSDLHRAVYLLAFSVIIGPTACVLGITAMRKARRAGAARPRGAIGGVVLGAVAAAFAISVLMLYLSFPKQLTSYVHCVREAQVSGRSTQACATQLYKSIQPGAPGR